MASATSAPATSAPAPTGESSTTEVPCLCLCQQEETLDIVREFLLGQEGLEEGDGADDIRASIMRKVEQGTMDDFILDGLEMSDLTDNPVAGAVAAIKAGHIECFVCVAEHTEDACCDASVMSTLEACSEALTRPQKKMVLLWLLGYDMVEYAQTMNPQETDSYRSAVLVLMKGM